MLDYTNCGKDGEPEVVHIDQELDYQKTFIAKDFETFIRTLVNSDEFDSDESDQDFSETAGNDEKSTISNDGKLFMLEYIKNGRFSDVLEKYFKATPVNFDKILRNLFTAITMKEGYIKIENDDNSYLAIDIQFYLLTINKSIRTKEYFIKQYIPMVAMGNNHISSYGYEISFVEIWFDERVYSKQIVKNFFFGFKFTNQFKEQLFERIRNMNNHP
jgi:hypothetical protein